MIKGDTMNETIGAKGGHNDYRRILKIKEKKKKEIINQAEEQEIKELERKVKKQQRYVLIKTLPIVLVGQTIKTLYETATGKEDKDIQEANSKWRIKEYGIDHTTESIQERKLLEKAEKQRTADKEEIVQVVLEDGRKVTVVLPERPKKQTVLDEINIFKYSKTDNYKKQEEVTREEEKSEIVEEKEKVIEEKPTKQAVQDFIAVPTTKVGIEEKENEFTDDFSRGEDVGLSERSQVKLDKLKARKIIDEYEKQLKDIRYDLRQLVFEYNVLVDEAEQAVVSKEMENVLEKLSDVIRRIDELKRKIAIDDLDKYDDNYIYTLVEGYLEEFKDKKLVEEIKDSPLYILIAEKLEELDVKKNGLSREVDAKKEQLEEKEEKFELLKEKFINIDKINKELLAFQDEQDRILREVREKVKNAVSVQEKVEVQVEAMNRQSARLFRLLSLSMLFPGARSARSMAATAAAYLYFVNNILNPKTTTKKYKVITVRDYSKDIEKNMGALDDAFDLLGKTSKQIDKMISQISDEFSDYFGIIKEADELIANLKKVKAEISEKEYEMEKIKEEQRLILEKNNAKVMKRGTYPM